MVPAIVASWSRVRFLASVPKYVLAADSTPYAPCPKYTAFRYFSRIWRFEYLCSSGGTDGMLMVSYATTSVAKTPMTSTAGPITNSHNHQYLRRKNRRNRWRRWKTRWRPRYRFLPSPRPGPLPFGPFDGACLGR